MLPSVRMKPPLQSSGTENKLPRKTQPMNDEVSLTLHSYIILPLSLREPCRQRQGCELARLFCRHWKSGLLVEDKAGNLSGEGRVTRRPPLKPDRGIWICLINLIFRNVKSFNKEDSDPLFSWDSSPPCLQFPLPCSQPRSGSRWSLLLTYCQKASSQSNCITIPVSLTSLHHLTSSQEGRV